MPKPDTPQSPTSGSSTNEKLDQVIYYLHRMDKRDKMRTIGGFIRTLISFIPLILLLWSVWYIIQHGDELMETIIKQTATATADAAKGSSQGMLEQFMKQYDTPKK